MVRRRASLGASAAGLVVVCLVLLKDFWIKARLLVSGGSFVSMPRAVVNVGAGDQRVPASIPIVTFGDRCGDAIAKQIAQCGFADDITCVTFASKRMTCDGYRAIAGLRHLTCVAFEGDAALDIAAINVVSLSPSVKQMSIRSGRFGDRELLHIVLPPALDHLYLSGTAVTDDAMHALTGCHSLRVLALDNTHITDRGIAILRPLRLYGLYLRNSSATTEGISDFMRANPQCEVLPRVELQIQTNVNLPDVRGD